MTSRQFATKLDTFRYMLFILLMCNLLFQRLCTTCNISWSAAKSWSGRRKDGMGSQKFISIINECSATFKLTRDSQGAPYSSEKLEDYRTKLRGTRDAWNFPARLLNVEWSWIIEPYFARICNKLLITWFIIVAISSFPSRSAPRSFFRLHPQKPFLIIRYPGRKVDYISLERFMSTMKNPKIQSELIR